jgi:AcrR family transcriptional regulator
MSKTQPLPQSEERGLPPEAVPEGTKGRILEAALQLFAERGFHGSSIRDIGAAVGLRAANLYLYFPSKEHLLAELVRLGHEVHHRYLRRALIMGAGSGPVEQVKSVVRAHVRAHAQYPALVSVANHEARALPPELLEPALVFRHDSIAIVTEVVQRGVDEGLFAVTSTWLATAAISAMGMRVASWYRPDAGFSIDDIAENYAEFAIRLLTPLVSRKARRE